MNICHARFAVEVLLRSSKIVRRLQKDKPNFIKNILFRVCTSYARGGIKFFIAIRTKVKRGVACFTLAMLRADSSIYPKMRRENVAKVRLKKFPAEDFTRARGIRKLHLNFHGTRSGANQHAGRFDA